MKNLFFVLSAIAVFALVAAPVALAGPCGGSDCGCAKAAKADGKECAKDCDCPKCKKAKGAECGKDCDCPNCKKAKECPKDCTCDKCKAKKKGKK